MSETFTITDNIGHILACHFIDRLLPSSYYVLLHCHVVVDGVVVVPSTSSQVVAIFIRSLIFIIIKKLIFIFYKYNKQIILKLIIEGNQD